MSAPPNQPMRIACLGECMIELSGLDTEGEQARLGVAGDTLNTAVYLARLLPPHAASISYLTALGTDHLSQRIMSFVASEGVHTTHIARIEDKLPGIYAIELNQVGERSFRYWRNESAARSMFQCGALDFRALGDFDVIYLSGISLAILPYDVRAALLAKLAELKSVGRVIAFDSNYRRKLWRDVGDARLAIDAAWQVTTIALPSIDDEICLEGVAPAQNVIGRISDHGPDEVVLKRGSHGPLISAGGGLLEDDFSPADSLVDTTAAGDSFNAGYLAGRILELDPLEAAHLGHRLAVHVVGKAGAIVDTDEFAF